MSQDAMRYWVAASLIPKFSVSVYLKRLRTLGDIEDIFRSSRQQLEQLKCSEELIESILQPQWSKVDQAMRWLENESHELITIEDDRYPECLKSISCPPLCLYVRGNAEHLVAKQIAVVGSRKPTPKGQHLAFDYAAAFAKAELCVTSGLALGIDAAAHRGALAAGGKTIAVLGCGVDQIYPKSNRILYDQILSNDGLIISEYPLGTAPHALLFPRRNRIISGFSLGVLVVEAAVKSGSLITARLAGEQGRDVFAIPGDIQQPLSRGCHHLIQQGAKLVMCVQDVLEEFGALYEGVNQREKSNSLRKKLTNRQLKLLDLMGNAVCSIDQIASQSGLAFDSVCSMLLEMELSGIVQCVPGGYQSLV